MSCAAPSATREGVLEKEALTDGWLSCFDFSDLQPADLSELLVLSCTESLDTSDVVISEENPPFWNSWEENPPFFNPSECFPSILKPDEANRDGYQCQPTFICEAATPLHNDGFPVFSPHDSDGGSSFAIADVVVFYQDGHVRGPESYGHAMDASSHKRQHKDMGESQLNSSDKKQQRLLRNRKLAFESRQRKKCYMRDLEAKCNLLEQECNQLQQQVCFTTAENAVLKQELSQMRMKGGDGVTEPAVLFEGSLPLEFLSLLICLLLIARLSLCGSPFLALVLRAVLCPQSPSKAEGLVKEQVDRKRCFYFMIVDIQSSVNHLSFHRPFWDCGLFMVQVPFSYSMQGYCKYGYITREQLYQEEKSKCVFGIIK